jgi:hypothetical protein
LIGFRGMWQTGRRMSAKLISVEVSPEALQMPAVEVIGGDEEERVELRTVAFDLRRREHAMTQTLHDFLERPEYVSWEHGGINE